MLDLRINHFILLKAGAGNYVKMVQIDIEYGDTQLIGVSYDMLKTMAGMSNRRIARNILPNGTRDNFLIEFTSLIFAKKDRVPNECFFLCVNMFIN